ncbi:MAG: DUF7662 domain-containing protein [Brevundimonas aurantiaca]|jgi:hypothetical protein|uniref:DUF7662 domain-containing protein n=1 Tax=Brevundimonas TaxID=41275 RepID=UPI00024762C7|nr:hypothetical protein [Brevundimonas sp.]EHN71818.1 hypothetical protein SMCF_8774 [Streptomyces coelicoflavus ZG0656]KAK0334059.1 hypothetical protein LTR94_018154 [Friedmanniomyces endolithicus]MBJ7484132.1 hypothetical protein [Brevundimonas sp.]MZE49520.1 hypothetical protein [Streptomyces sp. SID5477]
MAKYDPLGAYLRRQRTDRIELTFREIENLIGYLLPKAALSDAWWSPTEGTTPKGVQHAAWTAAGYSASKIAPERVVFSR